MESQTLNLNEDTQVYGFITDSRVSLPINAEGRPEPIYSVTIKPTPGLAEKIGLMYWSCLGPFCVNGEDLMREFSAARELTFESIQKPLVSGQNLDTNEFDHGQRVRVSCRFEVRDGQINSDGNGEWKFPLLILRFVDAEWEEEKPKAEPIPEPDPETLKFYDF